MGGAVSAPNTDPSENESDAGPSVAVRWTAGSVIAAALAVGVVLYYRTDVCDQQLTESGEIVTVCRSLQAMDPPVIAVGIVVFIALTAFFSEVSGFGISFKRELRRTARNAELAVSKADNATSVANSAEVTSTVAQQLAARGAHQKRSGLDVSATVDDLIDQYNAARKETLTSAERTAKLTTIVSTMISALSGAGHEVIDLDSYIKAGDNDGRRVAAYAYLYANPDPRLTATLVRAILTDETRFGQYWAVRALRRLISVDPAALDLNSRRELERLLAKLKPTTDRAFELRQALTEAQAK
jgi:hypothetical protein